MDTSLMQMYNHLASVPPPGVNTGTSGAGTAPGPQYPSLFYFDRKIIKIVLGVQINRVLGQNIFTLTRTIRRSQ